MVPSDELSGEFAGRYIIDCAIGHGGSAVVYRARDTATERVVAIKVLRTEFAASIGADRFIREIRLTAELRHPNIIPVLDSGEHDGQLFVVLPYMAGGTLRERLTREKQLSIEEAIRITRSIGTALAAAHAAGFIHRDVKPENVLFDNDVPYLADFGIARAVERATDVPTTTTGIIHGTPAYMSPEQAAGETEMDARTDVYSLGCVAYEMIAGMPAFAGPTQQSVMAQRLIHRPREMSVYRPSVPAGIERAIDKATSPASSDRWRSMDEFLSALEAADPTGPPAAATRRPRRVAWAVAGAALLLLAIAIVLRPSLRSLVSTRAVPLDSTRLAIAPFDLLDVKDTVWRYGIVDVLARDFDGAGPLRTVSPTVVINGWHGRSDAASAERMAGANGAGLAVFGQIIQTGADVIEIRATLYDVIANLSLAEEHLTGPAASVVHLADSLALRLLHELGRRGRGVGATRGASLGSASVDAMRMFLRGEQLLRHNEFAAARDAYESAVGSDSTFALAFHRLRTVNSALGAELDSASRAAALRAGSLNHGLAPRDSLLILADSLEAPLYYMLVWDPASQAQERRRFAVLETAARLYPRDPEIWEQLGEARIHRGDRVGATPEQALAAFETAVALDPGYNPPYFHAIELAMGMRSVDSIARLVAQVRASAPDDSRYRVLASMLKDLAFRRFRAALPPDGPRLADVVSAAYLLHRWMGDPFAAEQLLRAVLESPRADAGPLRQRVLERLVSALLYHGKPDEASRLMEPTMFARWPARAITLGEMRALPRDSADRLFRRWLESPKPAELLSTLPWWNDQRDLPSLARARHRFDSLAAGSPAGSAQREAGRYGSGAAVFYSLLAAGDSARALDVALQLADSLCTDCAPERLATARLLRLRGRAAEGARLLDRHPLLAAAINVAEVEWHLERARLATAARDDETARRSYSFVARAWREAEPSLRPAIAEAHDWLAAHR